MAWHLGMSVTAKGCCLRPAVSLSLRHLTVNVKIGTGDFPVLPTSRHDVIDGFIRHMP